MSAEEFDRKLFVFRKYTERVAGETVEGILPKVKYCLLLI